MASTNKTTNYELSQFLGTDKPAWLSDYNSDMSKIDTQMKANADAATAAGGTADAATTNIGTLSNLTTDAKTSLVAAVNEVDSHADSAASTASSALSASSANTSAITALTNYLDISNTTTYSSSSFSVTSGGGTLRNNTSITVAKNSDGSLAKIYGMIVVDNQTSSTGKVKLNADTGLHPDSKITVTYTGFTENYPTHGIKNLNIDINTDGTIEFYGTVNAYDDTYIMRGIACLIFVKNFGDQPE